MESGFDVGGGALEEDDIESWSIVGTNFNETMAYTQVNVLGSGYLMMLQGAGTGGDVNVTIDGVLLGGRTFINFYLLGDLYLGFKFDTSLKVESEKTPITCIYVIE